MVRSMALNSAFERFVRVRDLFFIFVIASNAMVGVVPSISTEQFALRELLRSRASPHHPWINIICIPYNNMRWVPSLHGIVYTQAQRTPIYKIQNKYNVYTTAVSSPDRSILNFARCVLRSRVFYEDVIFMNPFRTELPFRGHF